MARNWIQAMLTCIVIGALTFGVGWGLLAAVTASDRFLAIADVAAPVVAAAPVSVALDEPPASSSQDEILARRESIREAAAAGLNLANLTISGSVTGLAILWSAYAWSQLGALGGMMSSRRAGPAWAAGVVAGAAAVGGMIWFVFNRQGAAAFTTPAAMGAIATIGGVLAWLSYHLSTALAVPAELRASVPFAARLIPLGRSRR